MGESQEDPKGCLDEAVLLAQILTSKTVRSAESLSLPAGVDRAMASVWCGLRAQNAFPGGKLPVAAL